MNYSKIVSIEVFNFMSYKHVKAIFDEKGILNFKGYNHSGKSGMLRAIVACLMNLNSRSHTKYIHYGEDYFRIIISFDDGVSIVRDKYINGQSLYEMYKDDKLVFTTKQGNKLSKVEDVPKVIADYLGLIPILGGYLNYQTRKSPLWLIDTKGSENYYSVHEILRTEEIARANTLLNSDKNKLNSEITEIEIELQQAELLLSSYSSINEDLLLALSEKEVEVQNLQKRMSSIREIYKIVSELEGIKDIPVISCIDIRKLNSISQIEKIELEIENTPEYPEVDIIPTKRLNKILSISNSIDEFSSVNTKLADVEIGNVDISKYAPLGKLQNELKELIEVSKKLSALSKEEEELKKQKTSIVQEATKMGIKFVECENCGTLLEVK